MTAPLPTTQDFFNSFSQLVQLKNQQDQLKLSQRVQGANMIELATRVLQGLPKDSRDPVIKAFAAGSGLDPDLFRQAIEKMPETPGTITARKLEAGAGAVPDAVVAAAGLAGTTPGAMASDALKQSILAQIQAALPGATPELAQATISQLLTGMAPGQLAQSAATANLPQEQLQFGAQAREGTVLTAPQVAGMAEERAGRQASLDIQGRQLAQQAQISNAELQQRERLTASAQAIDMLEAQIRAQAAGGGGATTAQQLEALQGADGMLEMLNKGNMTDAGQLNAIFLLQKYYRMAGMEDKDIATLLKNANLAPGIRQKLGRLIPALSGSKP